MTNQTDKRELREELERKIRLLSDTTWEKRVDQPLVDDWIGQFDSAEETEDDERIHALFLLSHFLYFGQMELRCLLRSLYRDMIRTPTLHEIRREFGDTLDRDLIEREYGARRARMRFLAIGNPSESGMHLLYYFRQENGLPKDLFINTHEIFGREVAGGAIRATIRDRDVNRYIFIDDLCGSGTQASRYSRDLLGPLKALTSEARVSYLALFATSNGLSAVRRAGCFDTVEAVFEFDESFRSVDSKSRIFSGEEGPFDRLKIRKTCEKYGGRLSPRDPLGYKNGQLLIGFSHNTPDNTLPIFWGGDEAVAGPWKAVFKRYDKVYGI